MSKISKRRAEMGEEAWAEYQKQRKNNTANRYKQRNIICVIEWRYRTKLKLIEYKGGKCEMCGYNKPIPCCYDFHHKNPEDKEFSISSKCLRYEALKKEVDKCILVCRNCHGEIHSEIYKKQREETKEKHLNNNKEIDAKLVELDVTYNIPPKIKKPKKEPKLKVEYCKCEGLCNCGLAKECDKNKKFIVSKEELQELVNIMPMTKIGEKFGVSSAAIKKRCKSLNINIGNRRGYWAKVKAGKINLYDK